MKSLVSREKNAQVFFKEVLREMFGAESTVF
jgi:hypothetical protein